MSLFKVIGVALQIVGLATGNPAFTAWGTALLTADAYREQRKAKRRAIAEYNASLQDRLEMVDITPDQPRTIALGRVRAVEGVRRRWVSGANDEKLTMVVSLAGHEIDGIEQLYFDDVAVSLDGSGYVTTAPYFKGRTEAGFDNATLDGSGAVVMTLAHTPIGGVVDPVWRTGSGDGEQQGTLTVVSLVGTTLTLSGGPAGASAWVSYSYATGTYTARVRSYLGAATQNIGADLAAEYPGKITATDKFAGIACLVVDIDYDPDVYPQGRPNITAVFRGAKVYDPRLDSTAGGSGSHRIATPSTWTWSNNSALCAYHFARHANGWAVPAAEIMPAADVADEADFCDTPTAFTLRKPDDTTEEVVYQRHTCDIVISTAGDPRGAMDEILESMAGRSGWAGGVWKFRAGRMPASVFAMDQSWLAKRLQEDGTVESGPTLQFTNGVPREAKVNRVTGTCVDADQRYQVLPFPAIEDAVLIAAEGATYPLEVEYAAVTHIAHAQHLASIAIRRNQAALRIVAQCNLWAYRCELFDVGTLTLDRYAITAKTMEVVGWRWHPTEGVQLSLSEITDAIYTVEAELSGRDPAPNTALPAPWDVETLTGLAVTSGLTALSDGSIVSRARVAWMAAASQSVRAGGRTEIQFRQITDNEWQSWPEDGATTSAIIPALRQGVYYVFRGRFQSAAPLRVRGDWSTSLVHKMASTERDALGAALQAAVDAADDAADDAAAAAAAAATANATLADIASDSVLTPDEKPRVIQDYTVITAEQSGIDAQATNYSVTTEKTTYDTAVSALTTYLGTLTTPVAWNNLTGNTTIVGATFRGKFADVYTTRQALLDAISAAAKARLGALATMNTVDTPEIEPGATTDTFFDQEAGPVAVVAGLTEIIARTVGPYPAGVTLVATFSGEVHTQGTFSSGPSAIFSGARIDDDEDGAGANVRVNAIYADGQVTSSFSVTKRVILPASTSCEVRAMGTASSSGSVATASIDFSSASLLIEVLKN